MLDVSLIDNFRPSLGDMFTIGSASTSVTGQFDVENFPLLAGLDWLINYNANSIVLEIIAGVPTGDFDLDGDADGADFLAIQRNDPSLIPQWQADFGQIGNATQSSATVPEPGTLAILALGGLCLVCANQRRRSL